MHSALIIFVMPSHADLSLTQKIAMAGTFLDVPVLDHIS